MQAYSKISIEDCLIGLLVLGRLLSEIADSIPDGIDLKGARFDRFFAEVGGGNVLVPAHDVVLQDIANAVLTYFERECPGHIETMFRGTLQDFPLHNVAWAAARAFWDALLQFRVERQHLQDMLRASRIAADLRRRPTF